MQDFEQPLASTNGTAPDAELSVQMAADLVAEADRVVVLTGAGISTDSSIPDFRGTNGVWTKNPKAEKMASIQAYLADPEVRESAWQARLASPVWEARPNAGHRALLGLEESHKLDLLITQNIDGLHHQAGSDPDRIVEIHGNIRTAVCWSCDYRAPMTEVLDRVRAGETDPPCPVCAGILKSSTISFGQSLVEADIERSMAAAGTCDVLVAVGSTLGVFPIARVVPTAKAAGARIVIVNGDATEMDHHADALVRGSISAVLPVIVGYDAAAPDGVAR